jgi:hypothetical protein
MKFIPITVVLALATSGQERLSAARGRDRFTATDKLREGRFGTGTAGGHQSHCRRRFLSLFVPRQIDRQTALVVRRACQNTAPSAVCCSVLLIRRLLRIHAASTQLADRVALNLAAAC